MDREKVIKAYEDFVNGYECFCTSDDYEYEMHKAVLALLKEPEPVQVVWKFAFPHCPECGQMLPEGDRVRYCLHCGKPVIW